MRSWKRKLLSDEMTGFGGGLKERWEVYCQSLRLPRKTPDDKPRVSFAGRRSLVSGGRVEKVQGDEMYLYGLILRFRAGW
jgi:hypothetical protein